MKNMNFTVHIFSVISSCVVIHLIMIRFSASAQTDPGFRGSSSQKVPSTYFNTGMNSYGYPFQENFTSLKNDQSADRNEEETSQQRALRMYLHEWIHKKKFTKEQNELMNLLRKETLLYLQSIPNLSKSGADKLDNALFFSRFCIARDWKEEDARQMLRNHLMWRKSIGLDEPINTYHNANTRFYNDLIPRHNNLKMLRSLFPCWFHKIGKEGNPIYYCRIGKLNAQDLFKHVPLETFRDFFILQQEATIQYRLPAASLQTGQLVTQSVYVIDLDGLTLKSFNNDMRQLLQKISAVGDQHYPETMSSIIVVNTPFIFRVIWAFLAPILPERVKAYVFFYGNRSKYLPELLKFIDRDALPEFLGGDDILMYSGGQRNVEIGPWAEHMPELLS